MSAPEPGLSSPAARASEAWMWGGIALLALGALLYVAGAVTAPASPLAGFALIACGVLVAAGGGLFILWRVVQDRLAASRTDRYAREIDQ